MFMSPADMDEPVRYFLLTLEHDEHLQLYCLDPEYHKTQNTYFHISSSPSNFDICRNKMHGRNGMTFTVPKCNFRHVEGCS
jgi:hypothetical protein